MPRGLCERHDPHGAANVSNLIGTAWGLGSAISWACANAAIHAASRRVGSWSALVGAQVIGGTIAVLVALAHDGLPSWSAIQDGAGYLLGAGLAAALAYGGLFEALGRGQVAIVSPIISAWSVGSVFIVAIRGQPPTAGVAIGVAMVVIGNIMVTRSVASRDGSEAQPVAESLAGSALTQGSQTPRSAILWAVLAACGFALMVPMLDQAGGSVGRLWAIPLVWLVELTVLVPVLAGMRLLSAPRNAGDLVALGRAASFEVGGFICLSLGLGAAGVSIVSPVSSLSTAGSVALGVLVLRERVTKLALGGALFASAGVVVINL